MDNVLTAILCTVVSLFVGALLARIFPDPLGIEWGNVAEWAAGMPLPAKLRRLRALRNITSMTLEPPFTIRANSRRPTIRRASRAAPRIKRGAGLTSINAGIVDWDGR